MCIYVSDYVCDYGAHYVLGIIYVWYYVQSYGTDYVFINWWLRWVLRSLLGLWLRSMLRLWLRSMLRSMLQSWLRSMLRLWLRWVIRSLLRLVLRSNYSMVFTYGHFMYLRYYSIWRMLGKMYINVLNKYIYVTLILLSSFQILLHHVTITIPFYIQLDLHCVL